MSSSKMRVESHSHKPAPANVEHKGISEPMRILILGINYYPEHTSVSPFTTGLSEHLAAQGHSVKVITAFPYYPDWRTWDGYRGRITQKEYLNGVHIRRVLHFIPWKPSRLIERLLHDFSFAVAAFVGGLGEGKCDVIYCSSPPPAVSLAAYALSRLKRIPYTIKLTDLASEAALATGILRPGPLVGLARKLEDFLYRNAEAVFCLCGAFIDSLRARGIAATQLHRIPDWGDTENIQPRPGDSSFRAAHNISPGQFLLLHTGNMGKKQDLVNLVRAAELTRHDEQLVWVIVGEGEDRELVESEIQARELWNVRLLPLQPREALCRMYADADALLLNQKASVKDAVIPSKLLTYMSSGRPVIASVDTGSEAACEIRRAKCGLIVAPEDPAALVEGVASLRTDFVLRAWLGANGRAHAEAYFTKASVLGAYDRYFESRFAAHPTEVLLLGGSATAD
jgi:putative colanic acid biosynthesis glycosyltransferase WcaI